MTSFSTLFIPDHISKFESSRIYKGTIKPIQAGIYVPVVLPHILIPSAPAGVFTSHFVKHEQICGNVHVNQRIPTYLSSPALLDTPITEWKT